MQKEIFAVVTKSQLSNFGTLTISYYAYGCPF
nr:MAG TPA: hypothetical protein [Caudoviricetes sp.]